MVDRFLQVTNLDVCAGFIAYRTQIFPERNAIPGFTFQLVVRELKPVKVCHKRVSTTIWLSHIRVIDINKNSAPSAVADTQNQNVFSIVQSRFTLFRFYNYYV